MSLPQSYPLARYEDILTITQTPTISAAAIYTAGDALGGLLTFADAVLAPGMGAEILKIVIIDNDGELAPIDLVLFNQTFAPTADNAAFDPTDADMQNCIGFIDVVAADYTNFTDNSVAASTNDLRMPFAFTLVTGGTGLFGQMVVRSTPTYTAIDDLTVNITVRRRWI